MSLAVEAVRGLLVAKLTALGQTALRDRDEFDALTEPELPATLVDEPGMVEISWPEGRHGGAAMHLVTFSLTFAAATRSAAHANLQSAANALADDFTLGGQVSDLEVLNYGGDENNGKDLSAITLEIRVRFETPPNDFGTLST